MTLSLGYLLPTRERIMTGAHATGPLLRLADRAESLGLESVWIGDSLLAKPRHEPLALIAAIAGRTRRLRLGTAVLLPMLRNPVLLAHQLATIDRIAEGRLIVGLGTARDIPAIRAEFAAAGVPFEKRIGRMMEQVRLMRALWAGEEPVDWDGLWTVRGAALAPTPHTPGGPPLWGGGSAPGALRRAGRSFQGWFPSGPGGPVDWGRAWREVRAHAAAAGRDPAEVTGAAYVTISVDEDRAKAEAGLDRYLEHYYLQPAARIRAQQYCFAGTRAQATEWLAGFAAAGARHLCVRFAGGAHERQMDALAAMRAGLAA